MYLDYQENSIKQSQRHQLLINDDVDIDIVSVDIENYDVSDKESVRIDKYVNNLLSCQLISRSLIGVVILYLMIWSKLNYVIYFPPLMPIPYH